MSRMWVLNRIVSSHDYISMCAKVLCHKTVYVENLIIRTAELKFVREVRYFYKTNFSFHTQMRSKLS